MTVVHVGELNKGIFYFSRHYIKCDLRAKTNVLSILVSTISLLSTLFLFFTVHIKPIQITFTRHQQLV